MQCPVCKHYHLKELGLHSEGFHADIKECRVCGTTWSTNHGLTAVIKNMHKNSILEGSAECVEEDNYILAV